MRPPDWQSCLGCAVVGVRTAVANVHANVAGLNAPVASAVAVDSVVALDSLCRWWYYCCRWRSWVPAVVKVSAVIGIPALACVPTVANIPSTGISTLLLSAFPGVPVLFCVAVGPAAVDDKILAGAKISGFAAIPNAVVISLLLLTHLLLLLFPMFLASLCFQCTCSRPPYYCLRFLSCKYSISTDFGDPALVSVPLYPTVRSHTNYQ